MINIWPVSDLRSKYPEIEEIVLKEDGAVYLTENGYGSMVVLSFEKYNSRRKRKNTYYRIYVKKYTVFYTV